MRSRRLHSSQELTQMSGGMLRVRRRLGSLEEAERRVLGFAGHATVIRSGLRDHGTTCKRKKSLFQLSTSQYCG